MSRLMDLLSEEITLKILSYIPKEKNYRVCVFLTCKSFLRIGWECYYREEPFQYLLVQAWLSECNTFNLNFVLDRGYEFPELYMGVWIKAACIEPTGGLLSKLLALVEAPIFDGDDLIPYRITRSNTAACMELVSHPKIIFTYTAISRTCKMSDIVTAKLIERVPADKVRQAMWKSHNWALYQACMNGSIETVRAFSKVKGANLSTSDNQALTAAIEKGHRDIVRILISDDKVMSKKLPITTLRWMKERKEIFDDIGLASADYIGAELKTVKGEPSCDLYTMKFEDTVKAEKERRKAVDRPRTFL